MNRVYYNDNEPFVCDWLENLIREKLLPAGDVDRRPIQEVMPSDVQGYTQCHFFAGIGGWPYALQLAGWGDRPVWTGSCPCQPFSAAGQRQSHRDERHLWPEWFRLIRECRPDRIFGEQVSRAIGLGWMDAVRADLETENYAVGAVVLGAHSVGAPHIRNRFYFVADPYRTGRQDATRGARSPQSRRLAQSRARHADQVQYAPSERCSTGRGEQFSEACETGWSMGEWPAEPRVDRVVDGLSDRVGYLRDLGNAIVPATAAAFVSAYMEVS